MVIRADAAIVIEALDDPGGWIALRGCVEMAAMTDEQLAAVMLALEDRAEELYAVALGKPAPSCMLATVWLYGKPFCAAAVAEIGRRGRDFRSLKQEVTAARGAGGAAGAAGDDWLA